MNRLLPLMFALCCLGCTEEEDDPFQPAISINNLTAYDVNVTFEFLAPNDGTFDRATWFAPADNIANIPHERFADEYDPSKSGVYLYGDTSWFALHSGGAENPCGVGMTCNIDEGEMNTAKGITVVVTIDGMDDPES